jgi:hypothetical protein
MSEPTAAAPRRGIGPALALAAASAALMGAAFAAGVLYRVPLRAGASAAACHSGNALARLELLFGMGKADGGAVGEHAWRDFVDGEVTPRFPDGLTVVAAEGQWRNGGGALVKERARLLLIFYRPDAAAEAQIEDVRAAYKARFGQQSVLRADGASCVSF